MVEKKARENIKYSELSYRLMEIMFEVHNQLGPGFTENIYEKAVLHELKNKQIPFEEQKEIQVFYKGELMGNYRLDLVVDNKVIVELKAVSGMNDVYRQQLLSYLKATGLELGLLINFGGRKVESTRVVYSKHS